MRDDPPSALHDAAHVQDLTSACATDPLSAVGDALVVHYQPVVDLATRGVVGVEALVRRQHQERAPLELSALRTACLQGAHWASQGLRLEMTVNLSSQEVLDPGLVAQVRRVLDETGLDPSQLLLQVEERALTDDVAVGAALRALADLGVQLGLDDFGTGFSSLLHLKRYPISALKIASTFVAGLGTDRTDEAIVASIASLSAALGSRCIAGGVDTAQQLAHLVPLGCQAQGRLLASPVPPAELPAAVDRAEAALDADPPARPRSRRAPAALNAEVAERMREMRRSGASALTIAAALNQVGAPHPQGIRWHAASVSRFLDHTLARSRAASAR